MGRPSPAALEREVGMPNKTVLTSAELAYINDLVTGPSAETHQAQGGFRLDGGDKANTLLLRLAAKAKLTFDAEFDEATG